MTDTKQLILEKALYLFSEYGYEAVSMKQLAAEVGIKAPSLYKHFPSKQDIFDALIELMSDIYEKNSVLSFADPDKRLSEYRRIAEMSPEKYADVVCEQLDLITSSPMISMVRKLLTIEQFRNSRFCSEIERRQYTDIMNYNRGLLEYFTERNILIDGDADVMTLQFTAPVTVELQRIDRLPEVLPEAKEIIHKHVVQFFRLYRKDI